MEARTTKVLGSGRIVALALISLSALGLAYLHFSSGSDSVTVPSGSKAGQLTLHSSHYETEDGSYRADRGTLVVPENRHDARSRLIALPVTRIRARSANPGAPIFRLQGGPGVTNMDFPDASRFVDKHDVVLVGYRGIDGSSKLDCPEVTSARAHSREFLTEKSYRADAAAFKACAERLQADGVDLAGYTLPERVDDLEAARRAFGYGRIDLLSESAGTRTAMIYAWRYPKSIHRSVMIGANPPGHFLWDAKTTDQQIQRYAAACAKDASCRDRKPGVAAALKSAFGGNIPDRFWFLPIKKGNVKASAFFGLMNATTEGGGPLSGPMTIDTLRSADNGDGSGAWLLSVLGQTLFPRMQVWGDVAAVSRTDAAYARRFFASPDDRGSIIGTPGTDLIWDGGRVLDAWPASPDETEYNHVRNSNVETLVIGGRLDFATPPQWATRDLLPHLPNGRQVVLDNMGHTDDFWADEPAAGTHLINTYFDTGRVDTSLYKNTPIDFTNFSQDWIAKIVLATMLGFGGLTVLSLLWMPLRAHRRGAFGRKSGTAVRSVYAFVLGLGGWMAGVLVVLTALPTVPLQDETLALVSIAVPVALATYYGSKRTESYNGAIARFVAAAAGAAAGSWLGFHVTTGGFGLAAPLLAIVGATAMANLAVLALDIQRDRATREAADTATAVALPETTA